LCLCRSDGQVVRMDEAKHVAEVRLIPRIDYAAIGKPKVDMLVQQYAHTAGSHETQEELSASAEIVRCRRCAVG
jgi:hypothetical protein